jgi:predicted Zn-dependent peptidase
MWPMSSAITVKQLSCGMTLLVERMDAVASASACWMLPCGVGTDPADRQGLAPMLAELIHRGCGARDSRAMADELDRLGLLRTASVGQQYLTLSATFVGARALECIGALTEMVRAPRFDEASIEPSRQLCLQSLAGLADNPQERAGELLARAHAQVPINRSLLGTQEGLAAVTRADLVRAWERQVRPAGCILAVAGNVDAGALAGALEGALTGWHGAPPALSVGDAPARGTYAHETEETNQVQILLAHEAPAESSPDARLERVVGSVLSGGSSSRLFSEVREKRALCYSVHSHYGTDRLFGRVTGYVGTTPDKAQQSLDVMLQQLRALAGGDGYRVEPVRADELARAQIGYKSRLVASGESTASRAGALASDWHRLRRARSLGELAAELEGVTLDQVNDYVARRRLGPVTVVTLGPRALTVA